jgi:hypothetical protein
MQPESSHASPDFASALRQEHERLSGRVEELRERAERLRALADGAEEMATQEERYLREIEGLLGIAPQLRLETLSRRLRGQRLQEVAIEILDRHLGPGEAIHYREWYDLLVAAGHQITGKNPIATFLAQIGRADEIERVAPRSGLYRLRAV